MPYFGKIPVVTFFVKAAEAVLYTNLLTKLSICICKFNEHRHSVIRADLKLLFLHRASAACHVTHTVTVHSWGEQEAQLSTITAVSVIKTLKYSSQVIQGH